MDANAIKRELSRLQCEIAGESPAPLNFGQIIDRLKIAIEQDERGADAYLKFDWGNAAPSTIASYRGYYEHVGIGFSGDYGGVLAGEFLKKLEDALGSDMTGWKGGKYVIHEGCEVWVACSGNTSDTRIIDVRVARYSGIEFVTAQIDD